MSSSIPTSGTPRVFESGFKRDTASNKIAWSLLPPNVWSSNLTWNKDVVAKIVAFLMIGGKGYLTDALDLTINAHGLEPLYKRFAKGAEVYGYFNWALGAPISVFIDSLGRHMWAQSYPEENTKQEDHIGAIQWNLAVCIHMLDMVEWGELPETRIIDIPAYTKISAFHKARQQRPSD